MGWMDAKRERPWYTRQTFFVAAFVGSVSLLLLIGWNSQPRNLAPKVGATGSANELAPSRPLHLLLPASNPEENLCKIILTSTVLGYPQPVLINWNKTYNDEHMYFGGAHLAKIKGAVEWMETLRPDQRDDLVVLSDAYDLWFQLPVSTLVDRYHAIIEAHDARMRSQPGMARAMKEKGIHQSVIFSAEKGCAPQRGGEPYCYLQPDSMLPADLWGNDTDTTVGYDPHSSFRKRWLNSGFIIGPVKDIIRVFERAFELRDTAIGGSDQSVFINVFAEQEYQREKWRQDYLSDGEKIEPQDFSNITGIEVAHMSEAEKRINVINPTFPGHQLMNYSSEDSEYGIGIDYWSSISHGTYAANKDRIFLTYNQTEGPYGMRELEEYDCNPLLGPQLDEDITRTGHPLSSDLLQVGLSDATVEQFAWTDIPLYTDMCSGTVPVAIHHNAGKYERWNMWPSLWIHDFAMRALEYYGYLGTDGDYDAQDLNPIVRTDGGELLTWPQLNCQEWHTSIFGEDRA